MAEAQEAAQRQARTAPPVHAENVKKSIERQRRENVAMKLLQMMASAEAEGQRGEV